MNSRVMVIRNQLELYARYNRGTSSRVGGGSAIRP